MLDRRFIADNVDLVEENCRRRGSQANVRAFAELEARRRAKQTEIEELNRKANEVSKSIGKAKDAAEREARKNEGRTLREKTAAAQVDLDQLTSEADAILKSIPNLSHPDAPLGADDQANLEVRRGKHEPPKFDFQPRDHVTIAESLGLLDLEGGAKVAGHGFYFLKNDAVLLELALQRYALDLLIQEGFSPTITPDLARNEILQGTGYIPRGPETQIYSIADSDLSLVATAEITLGGLLSGEILEADKLPIKLCGISHCYRTEAARTDALPAGSIASISSPKLRCSPLRFPNKARRCSAISVIWNAGCSMGSKLPTAWSIRPRATWAGQPIANSIWRLGCPDAATGENLAR